MALLQKDLFNSPYSGVFCATNDLVTLVPPGIPEDDMEAISEALGTKVEVITIGGSSVLGTLVAMNNVLTTRLLLILFIFGLGVYSLFPTMKYQFLSDEKKSLLSKDEVEYLENNTIKQGLDLKGGI